MRKFFLYTLVAFLFVAFLTPGPVLAEEDYSDTTYWNNLCVNSVESAQANQDACAAYRTYLSSQSSSLKDKLSEIEQSISSQQTTIDELTASIANVQEQITAKQTEIDTTQTKIDELQVQIDDKQKEIDQQQADVDTIKEKVKKRMVSSQSTMRNNKYFDLLMGASTFTEFLRIATGLASISEYDDKTMDDFLTLIEKLNKAKQELEEDQNQLEQTKTELESQQEDMLAMQYELELQQDAAYRAVSDLRAQQESVISDLDSVKDAANQISKNLNQIVASDGWINPVPGATMSRGVNWTYNNYHLGIDLAATVGTPVLAVANGYVLRSANGCGYGYLGNLCGWDQGGTYGGGNQVIMLCVINGGLYSIHYCHMQINSVVSASTMVSQGDQIGQVGSSGNSTGPHCHIEVKYLGNMSITDYINSWSGDLGFGTSWNNAALSHVCDYGSGAPCRMTPEKLFGYA